MKNLLSIDIDGTILPRGKSTIAEDVLDAINCRIDEGDIVIFNSGRPFDILREIVKDFHDGNVYLGICNGAALCQRDGRVVCSLPMNPENLKTMHENNPSVVQFGFGLSDEIYYYGEYKDSPYLKTEARLSKMKLHELKKNEDLTFIPLLKILFAGPKEEMDRIHLIYDRDKYDVLRTQPTLYEMMVKGAGKGSIIRYLEKQIKEPLQTYAFGDADNDAEALEITMGATFVNGTPLCKEKASYVSPFSEDRGFLDAMRWFHLTEKEYFSE